MLNKFKKQKCHTFGTVPKSNRTNRRNRGKLDFPNTQMHENSLSCLGTGSSIKKKVAGLN